VKDASSPTLVLTGAGGGSVDPALFRTNAVGEVSGVETIVYPGWRRYTEIGFSAEGLVEDLAAQMAARVTEGPIRLIGMSLGAHLAYAVALKLQASGRQIGGFCAVDPFMGSTASPSAGWKTRAVKNGASLLRDRSLDDFGRFVRARCWRASLRPPRGRLAVVIRRITSSGRLPWVLAVDPIFEQELSMRLLIQAVNPWAASLDRKPVALEAPAGLLRISSNVAADAVWRRRCPRIRVVEIPGDHDALWRAETASSIRETFIAATQDWG
jgi:thioesterase domain-containing protein